MGQIVRAALRRIRRGVDMDSGGAEWRGQPRSRAKRRGRSATSFSMSSRACAEQMKASLYVYQTRDLILNVVSVRGVGSTTTAPWHHAIMLDPPRLYHIGYTTVTPLSSRYSNKNHHHHHDCTMASRYHTRSRLCASLSGHKSPTDRHRTGEKPLVRSDVQIIHSLRFAE